MQESPLIVKSKQFALLVIRVCNQVKTEKKESVITNQLSRSGTSIGANIREAIYGHSKADFISKLQIALKECSESEYWIELLIEGGFYQDSTFLNDCRELKRILISSINTARKNLN
ncbi:MAG: four helix bundle protein [Clostridia bacterium]|jgi:four helix bundle protein|nr:four helix bundle protein [Clostridia bacterium]MCI9290386.1 four helix bundle protein [Clostridia bacterium]